MDQRMTRAADRLREVREELLDELVPILIEQAGEASGVHPMPARHHWPTDVRETSGVLLDVVIADDVESVCDPAGDWLPAVPVIGPHA